MQMKKALAIILVAVMLLSVIPVSAFAGAPGTGDIGTEIGGISITPATGFMVGETNYADFEEAVAAARTGSTKTVTCLSDIDLTSYAASARHYIDITDVTIDLNDHQMDVGTHWSVCFTGTNGKIMNGTCVGHDSPAYENYAYGIYIWGPGSGNLANSGGGRAGIALENLTCNYGIHAWNADVTVTNCNATGSDSYYAVWSDETAVVTIKSGSFTSNGAAVLGAARSSDGNGNIAIEGGDFVAPAGTALILGSSSSSKPDNVKFSGGTTNVVIPAINCADGFAPVTEPNEQGKYTVEAEPTTGFMVGSDWYETLPEAVAAASAGDTITVLSDATLSTTDIEIDKNLTIDFGSNTLTAARWPLINYANLTLKGTTGGLVSARGLVDNYGTLTIDSGVYNNTAIPNPAFWNNPGSVIIINGGTMDSNNAIVYNEGATLTINGGTLNSASSYKVSSSYYSYAIRNLPGSTCTINDGTITAVHGGVAAFGDGVHATTVVVNNATITTHNSEAGADAFYPLYISGNGTSMTVNGGTFSGPRTAVMIDDDDIGLTENTALTITGGTFIAPSGIAAVTRGDNDSYPAISGGSFSTLVPAEYCAEGFAPVTTPNAQGKYEVGHPNDGVNITVADTISDNFYLDEDFYGEDAVVVLNYNNQSNVSEAAAYTTETVAIGDMDRLNDAGNAHNGQPMFSITQAPAQATEPITIKVYANAVDAAAGTNPVREIEYNTYSYCRSIIEGDYADGLKELAESTLDYCAAAQTYFGYNTDNMATKDAAGTFYNNVAEADLSGVAGIACKPACITSASLVCKSDLEINLITKEPISVIGTPVLSTDRGGERFAVTTYPNGGYYVVHITGIEPANMNNTISISTDRGEIELTANAIMRAMSFSANANLATLAKAMYAYGAAAENYFA